MKETLWEKIRHKYWAVIPYGYRPGELWYKLKCTVWHRYTTVKPRGFPNTWVDRCELLPAIMFEILSQFIEGECSPGCVDWDGSGHTVKVNGVDVNVRQEMQALYDWWHQKYNKAYKEIHDSWWEKAFTIKVEDKFNPYPDEDNAEWYSWDQEFQSDDDEAYYHFCLDQMNRMDARIEEDLQEKLHRLVNLRRYLWT